MRANLAEGHPLSRQQQRLLELWQHSRALHNIQCTIQVIGNLDPQALHNAIEHVVSQHEILRTVFRMGSGEDRLQVVTDCGIS